MKPGHRHVMGFFRWSDTGECALFFLHKNRRESTPYLSEAYTWRSRQAAGKWAKENGVSLIDGFQFPGFLPLYRVVNLDQLNAPH